MKTFGGEQYFFSPPINLKRPSYQVTKSPEEVPDALKSLMPSVKVVEALNGVHISHAHLRDLRASIGETAVFLNSNKVSVAFFSWPTVKSILSKNNDVFIKGTFESNLGASVGFGLLTQELEDHKGARARFNPAFHRSLVSRLTSTIEVAFHKHFTEESATESIPLLSTMRKITYEATLLGTLGVSEEFINYEFVFSWTQLHNSSPQWLPPKKLRHWTP